MTIFRTQKAPSSMKSSVSLAALALALPLLTGCLFAPKVDLDPRAPESLAALEVINAASSELAAITPASSWWKGLGDPELSALVDEALAANPNLDAARARLDAARALSRGSRATLMPTVDGRAGASRTRDSEWRLSDERGGGPIPGMEMTQNNYSAGFSAAYELDFWGKNASGRNAAAQAVLGREAAYRAAALSIIAETAQAYFDVRAAQENLALIAREVDNRRSFLGLITTREESGLSSRLDLRRQEVEEAAVRASLPLAEEVLALANYRLAVLLGRNPMTFTLSERTLASYPTLPGVPDMLPVQLLRQRPDVLQAEAAARAAAAEIGVAIGDMLPSISLTGDYGWSSAEFDEWFSSASREWAYGANVRVPLFDGGRRAAQAEARRAELREAVAMYRVTVLQALEEMNGQIVAVAKGRERRNALYDQLGASQESSRIGQEQYRGGLIDLLDYLDMQRTELNIRSVLISADRDHVVDIVSLYRALGGGWDAAEVDPWLPVEKTTGRRILENFPIFAAALPEVERPGTIPVAVEPRD